MNKLSFIQWLISLIKQDRELYQEDIDVKKEIHERVKRGKETDEL